MASSDSPSPEPEERGTRPVTVLVALGVALVVLLAASAFLPRWWSHRIGNQADGSFTNGIGLGLFYGFAFTLLALVLLVIGLRRIRELEGPIDPPRGCAAHRLAEPDHARDRARARRSCPRG